MKRSIGVDTGEIDIKKVKKDEDSLSGSERPLYVFQDAEILVYWDIENVPVPRGKCADVLVSILKNFIERRYGPIAAFRVVLNRKRISERVVEDLELSGVRIHDIKGSCKNEADRKVVDLIWDDLGNRPQMNTVIVLISGDSDYSRNFETMKYFKWIRTVVIYRNNIPSKLEVSCYKAHSFQKVVDDFDYDSTNEPSMKLIVKNLPLCNSGRDIIETLIGHQSFDLIVITKTLAVVVFQDVLDAKRFKELTDEVDVLQEGVVIHYISDSHLKDLGLKDEKSDSESD